MYTEIDARQKVLSLVNGDYEKLVDDEIIVSSIHLSENKDYWIVRANSRAYIENGDQSRCYVGVNAYLFNTESGEIEIVGSAQSVELFLQEKYDFRAANGKFYVLICSENFLEKEAILRVHRVFNCSLKKAKHLLSEKSTWFSGQKRHLMSVQDLLKSKGIATEITLLESTEFVVTLDSEIVRWETLEEIIANQLLV